MDDISDKAYFFAHSVFGDSIGIFLGDDDNALTVAKGIIDTYTVDPDDDLVDLTYLLNHNLTVYHLYDFERQDTIGNTSPTATYNSDNNADPLDPDPFEGLGEAEFTLKHVQ